MTEEKSSVKGFGSKLRAEREAREISLEEISRVTKISIHLLHAMESDDWFALPGGIFTRNFIRLYASHIGLDAERWVDEYKHFIKAKSKAEGEEEATGSHDITAPELPRGWFYVLLAAIVVVLVGGYFLSSYFTNGNASRIDQGSQAPVENESAPLESGPEEVIQQSEPELEGIIVELMETRSRCWYQWWGDGELRVPADGANLALNEKVRLEAENKIRIYIAHLAGVTIEVNGTRVEWSELNPDPRIDDEGQTLGYVVEITDNTTQ